MNLHETSNGLQPLLASLLPLPIFVDWKIAYLKGIRDTISLLRGWSHHSTERFMYICLPEEIRDTIDFQTFSTVLLGESGE